MSVKVSVIIPVYNAEKYITNCIESLINQTLKDCEFIFVNDGSQDNSKQIIDNYKEIDSRIILLNQENQGVSVARNTGIKIATGEYVGFIDADDYVDNDMYGRLFETAKEFNADVVISNLAVDSKGHKIITKYPFPNHLTLDRDYIEKELLSYFLKEDNLNTVCTKIYRTGVLTKNEVQFPKNVSLGEDGLFNVQFLCHSSRAIYIDYTGYHYRSVDGSATRNIKNNDYFSRALEVYKIELFTDNVKSNDKEMIHRLKAIKLIKNVKSLIHVYFAPTKDLSFIQRYKYIKNMINNEFVREALPVYFSEYSSIGRYEKFILNLIYKRSTLGLFFATTYSRMRNK